MLIEPIYLSTPISFGIDDYKDKIRDDFDKYRDLI